MCYLKIVKKKKKKKKKKKANVSMKQFVLETNIPYGIKRSNGFWVIDYNILHACFDQ